MRWWQGSWAPDGAPLPPSKILLNLQGKRMHPQPWGPDVWAQAGPELSSLQRLQGRVLPALSSFWGLQASIPGLVATSLPPLPPSPRGFSSVSVSPLFCVL